MKKQLFSIPTVAAALLASSVHAAEPRADGVLDEWTPAQLLDPAAGGTAGQFVFTDVHAASRGTVLFVRFDAGIVRNLQSGSSSDGFPALTIARVVGGQNDPLLEIDFRNRSLIRLDGGPSVTWSSSSFELLPTFAAADFELTIDLGVLGVSQGDTIALTLGPKGGDGSLAEFTLADGPATYPQGSPDRAPGADIRVASLNTLRSGILDSFQNDRIGRLISSVDADVYCFQEEYDSSEQQIRTFLEATDPLENGAAWNVHKNFDNAVASTHNVIPIPENSSSFASAIVELPGGPVAVFTNHPKCCGYIGTSEDNRRIDQMNDLALTIDRLRTGGHGFGLLPYADAPVVLIGDWNLVGSRVPLDIITDTAGADLAEIPIGPLAGNSAATWFGGSTGPGSFTPGRLDLLCASRESLEPLGAFTLDTRILPAGLLNQLGVQSFDSQASDHLLLVADFEIVCPGDITGDDIVDVFDFSQLAGNFGTAEGAARADGDLDSNGTVDVFDFARLAERFGDGCAP